MRFVRRHPTFTLFSIIALSGIVGFVGGIAWCFALYPGSPQAPLFGMFITGPAGLIIGVIVGGILVVRANRTSEEKSPKV